jgi:hypothetical protein
LEEGEGNEELWKGRWERPTSNFERPTLNILILLNVERWMLSVGCSKFYGNMVLRAVFRVDGTDLQSFVFWGIVT